MTLEIVSTQIIRPSSPTPDHLRHFNLSIFDQLTPPMFVPLILFYSNTGEISIQEASIRLKKSLSVTLTSFFPFAAGSIRDNTTVDCNDDGVQYREARLSCKLRDILDPPDMEALGRLLPTVCGFSTEAGSGEFLLVQQNVFECGGMVIGICFSHKFADAATISYFLKSWAGACACDGDVVASAPAFTLGSLFPPQGIFSWSSYPSDLAHPETDKCTSKRFVFSASKVSSLQAKSCSARVSNPTRIEAVSSLIWQCAMRAPSGQSNTEPSYGLLTTVNLRKRIDPPLPDTSFGNFVGCYVSRANNADPTDLPSLVTKMRDAKEDYMQGYARKLRSPEGLGLICATFQQGVEFGKGSLTMYWMTSLLENFEWMVVIVGLDYSEVVTTLSD